MITALSALIREASFPVGDGFSGDTHHWSHCWKSVTIAVDCQPRNPPSVKENHRASIPLHLGLGKHCKKAEERMQELEGGKGSVLWTGNAISILKAGATSACVQPSRAGERGCFCVEWGRENFTGGMGAQGIGSPFPFKNLSGQRWPGGRELRCLCSCNWFLLHAPLNNSN